MTSNSPTRTVDTFLELQHYAEHWEATSEAPDAACFRAHSCELATPQLLGHVLFDQRHRWPLGQSWSAEKHFELAPGLESDAESAVAVVYNEFLLREHSPQAASEEECLLRFPHLADRLKVQFDLHRALSGQALGDALDQETQLYCSTTTDEPIPTIPGYTILAPLGRGGMAVVYRARHLALNRVVALKMILDGGFAAAEKRARFRHEAETLARLHHPNIVQIYDVGEHEVRPFLALEYVAGDTLAAQTAAVPQAMERAAHIVETLARAVHAAHQSGFFHPDGRLLAVGSTKGVALFDLMTGRELGFIATSEGGTTVRFEPSGALLTSGRTGTFRRRIEADADEPQLYRVGRAERLPFAPGTGVLARSPDGRFLAKAYTVGYGEDQYSGAWVWDGRYPNRPPLRLEADRPIASVAFSPDGRWLAAGNRKASASLYRVHESGRFERTRTLSGAGERVCFSPDGRWLWSGLDDGRLFDTRDWQAGPRLQGKASFSPDVRFLASSTQEGHLRLVDAETGREVARFEDPDLDESIPPTFSPDGSKLIAAKTAGVKGIQVWDLRRMGEHLSDIGLADDWPTFPPAETAPAPIRLRIDSRLPPYQSIHFRPDSGVLETTLALHSLALQPLNPEASRLRGEAWMQYGEADQAIEDFESAWLTHRNRPEMTRILARACNARAWNLVMSATGPDRPRALRLAERAAALVPEEPLYANTLGVALYRNRKWDEAVEALQRSLKLGRGKYDAFDLYFLAMCFHQRGEPANAKKCLDQARAWMAAQKNLSEAYRLELVAFDAEAAPLLGK